MPAEDLIVQSSREGHDTIGTNYDILFVRSQAGIKSDQVWRVVDSVYSIMNFARTMEPRLRPYVIPDSHIGKLKIASFGSINNATLKAITTTMQKHEVKQESQQASQKVASLFRGKPQQQQQPGGFD